MSNKTQLQTNNTKYASLIETLRSKAVGGGSANIATCTVTLSSTLSDKKSNNDTIGINISFTEVNNGTLIPNNTPISPNNTIENIATNTYMIIYEILPSEIIIESPNNLSYIDMENEDCVTIWIGENTVIS